MDSSKTWNSILDWLLAASLALTIVVATAGIDFRLAGLSVRSHGWARVAAAAIVLVLVRRQVGIASYASWLMRIAMLTAISGSIATWFRFLLTTIGGADSYGYVSASQLLLRGQLVEAAPVADWLSVANRLAVASPLGWAPAADGTGIVPTYPLGAPIVMAAFSAIGGSNAVFFVSPVMALLTLWLVYRTTRHWFDADTGLLAAAIVAWNPLFITYAKQPMSDMAATTWIMLAFVLALRDGRASAFLAGLAAGGAVFTRPALLIAAVVITASTYRGESRTRRLPAAAAGLAIIVAIQAAIQQRLYGSFFATGYGDTNVLFALSHVTANLKIFFVHHGWRVVGPLWLPGLIIGLFASRPEPRSRPAFVFAAVLLPYVFYLPFDHWETLRFLLPGIVPLTIIAAVGLMHVARALRMRIVAAVTVAVMLAVTIGLSESLLRGSSVWDVGELERRYPLAGDWINVNTPANSVVLANQHSGSLRWYGHRQTLRWDFIEPSQLTQVVRDLEAHGATAYVALEGGEVAMFDARFAGVIDELQVDHVGRIRNVSFRRLLAAE